MWPNILINNKNPIYFQSYYCYNNNNKNVLNCSSGGSGIGGVSVSKNKIIMKFIIIEIQFNNNKLLLL